MSQLSFIKHNIFALKRQYGLPLEIYSVTDITIDLATGIKQLTKQVYKINRAILLPRQLYKESNNKDFLDKETRQVIIDSKDYPSGYVLRNNNDYVIINRNRFNIISIESYDHNLAIIMTVTKVVGEQPAAVVQETLAQSVTITQDVVDVP